MINVIADGMGSCIYLDNEGIDDMIHYLTYLREKMRQLMIQLKAMDWIDLMKIFFLMDIDI